ncbi:hypothetical protein Taro_013895 [Colocasia esculenta]|uniref:DUF4219 domain-containing protein n=1 Tax=Colocasia esculenta TaxID=4460 RepID=A0A843UD57_COLES|nr:hypothetical protein [Colocasia esculenta]
MASKGYVPEGHSINRPPYFDGNNYSYWKNHMHVFLRAQDYEIWKVVNTGPYELLEDEGKWTENSIKNSKVNFSALNILQCAIYLDEYSCVSMCDSEKEMWDKLKLIYEGTSKVKENKANILVHEYEMFKMSPIETISDMFAWLSKITNGIKALGKNYMDTEIVRKVLRSLPLVWHTKATVNEDYKNLSSLTVGELIGSLMTYEINLKREEVKQPILKKKDVALKAKKSKAYSFEENFSSEDVEKVAKIA